MEQVYFMQLKRKGRKKDISSDSYKQNNKPWYAGCVAILIQTMFAATILLAYSQTNAQTWNLMKQISHCWLDYGGGTVLVFKENHNKGKPSHSALDVWERYYRRD